MTALVPDDAVVVINGRRTKATGTPRKYRSHGLEAGRVYQYEVRARVERNGKLLEDTKEVLLKIGEQRTLAFDFCENQDVSPAALVTRQGRAHE